MDVDDFDDGNEYEDPKESGEEDPVNGQNRKQYTPKTKKGKDMARMLINFCCLPNPVPTL